LESAVLYWNRAGQEYAKMMAEKCPFSSRVIELPADYRIEEAKRLLKEKEFSGAIQLMSACYTPSGLCSDDCQLDCHEINAVYVGVPKSSPEFSEYITVRAFEELGEDVRVLEENPEKHTGGISMRITIFPEFRAPCGKTFMDKYKTMTYLVGLETILRQYIEEHRV